MLQCQDAEHRRVARGADGHGRLGREYFRDLYQPVTAHPRLLRKATVVGLAQPPAVDQHTVAGLEPRVTGRLDDTGEVDARNQRKLANDR